MKYLVLPAQDKSKGKYAASQRCIRIMYIPIIPIAIDGMDVI